MNEYWEPHVVKRGFEEVADIFHLLNQDSLGYVAGSYAAWMGAYTEEWLPNDIDIFATSETAFEKLPRLLRQKAGWMVMENGDVVKAFEQVNSDRRLQLVKPHTQWKVFPDDILESFDLTVGMAILVSEHTTLAHSHAGGNFSKILRINEPVRTLKRVLKYHKRGVAFEDWELMKLFKAWDAMTAEQKQIAGMIHSEPEEVDATGFYFDYDDYFFEE